MKFIRVIQQHDKKCFQVKKYAKENPWSGIVKRSFYGSYAANEGVPHGHDHKWYVISCNDPNCPAEIAIHSKVLQDICARPFEMKERIDYSKVQFTLKQPSDE